MTLVGHPLETIKVRLQTQPSPPNHIYSGVADCFRKTLQWEGPAGLYKGFFFFTLGGLPSQGAYFYGYNWARERLGAANGARAPEQRLPLYALDMAAGLFAAIGLLMAGLLVAAGLFGAAGLLDAAGLGDALRRE